MAKLIFRLNAVADDEADEVKKLLTEHDIEFYESPAGNWNISVHALWINDESQYASAKRLIDDYEIARSQRVRRERQQQIDRGELETFAQRIFNKPVQFLITLAIILFILYVSIAPFLNIGQV